MTPNEKRDEVRELLESWGILVGYDVLLSELVDEIMLICLEVKLATKVEVIDDEPESR